MKNRHHFLSFFVFIQIIFMPLIAKQTHFEFDFTKGHQQWVGLFADYPIGEESFYELTWGWTTLPAQLLANGNLLKQGMILSGNNHSDDLFMSIKRQIQGLEPYQSYDLTFIVTIENNIPPGQFGIGGSPGESVFFKVGASKKEPKRIVNNGFYRLNVNKGNQSQSGRHAILVGDLANPLVDPTAPTYQPKQFVNTIPLRVKTDAKGRIWLFVGTDSGFEGPTTYYIANIKVKAKLL